MASRQMSQMVTQPDRDAKPTFAQLAGRSRSVLLGIGLAVLGVFFLALAANDMFHGAPWSKEQELASIGALILTVGGVVFAFGWYRITDLRRLAATGRLSEAVVTSIRQSRMQRSGYHRTGKTRTTWIIRYEYQDSAGHRYRGKSLYLLPGEVAGWAVGDRGIIRVDPERPSHSFWTGHHSHSAQAG